MSYKIQCDQNDPYNESITRFIKQEFPVLLQRKDAHLLDLLTDAIIASGQVRFGAKPSPESQVAIREIITHWTAKGEPIPFLLPWGSEKPDGSGVDIAELMAMKTLRCLQHRIQQYYSPGATFRIRVEDVSAPHLFFDRMDEARKEAALYTNGFVNLTRAIGVENFVQAIPESTLTTEKEFNAAADEALGAMELHIKNPQDEVALQMLAKQGWNTPLDKETLDYYQERYIKLYGSSTDAERRHRLARYFVGALTRRTLGIMGNLKEWEGKFLELSLAGPVPGLGTTRALRRIYYRTMPSSITSNHVPAWRAKGYLKINGETTASLTSFSNYELVFNPNKIVLTHGEISQVVQADYVVI